MQMYRVKVARKLADDMVDLVDVVVCAATQDTAKMMVSNLLGFGGEPAEYEVHRVKPSLFQVARRQIKNSLTAFDAETVNALFASTATFPNVTENMPEEHWYSVDASAMIRAEDENVAIKKLARGIDREMDGQGQKNSTRDLSIKCDRADYHPRPSAPSVEQNALFSSHRFFQGGDART